LTARLAAGATSTSFGQEHDRQATAPPLEKSA
jgi:hypothetical protein